MEHILPKEPELSISVKSEAFGAFQTFLDLNCSRKERIVGRQFIRGGKNRNFSYIIEIVVMSATRAVFLRFASRRHILNYMYNSSATRPNLQLCRLHEVCLYAWIFTHLRIIDGAVGRQRNQLQKKPGKRFESLVIETVGSGRLDKGVPRKRCFNDFQYELP